MNIENKTNFFIDDGNSLKQKAQHHFTFALGGTKGCFSEKKHKDNKCITWTSEQQKEHLQRPNSG